MAFCSLHHQHQQAALHTAAAAAASGRRSSIGTPLRPPGGGATPLQRSPHTAAASLLQPPQCSRQLLQCSRQLLPCQPSRLQLRPPQLPQRPQVAAGAAAAAAGAGAGDATGAGAEQQPWQPPARPRGPFSAPQLSLWQLGGPLAWTYMLGYLALMLLMPIAALLAKSGLVPLAEFVGRATEPVALSAYYVSFSMALLAGAVNAVFGFLLAWVLVKYEFPGKKWIDAAVDLPFALPTSVAGLTLATVYGEEGLLGRLLMGAGINVVYTRLGVAVAMIFVSFPFVVRTMQPVLQEMEREVEEAAWSLGASPWQTFTQVLLPPLLPPLLTGTALAFSRALGEFGSVVIVSSNFPFKDLIAPVLIFQCLEQYDFVGATVIGTVLLLISLVLMVGVNWLQSYSQRFRK